MTSRRSMLFTVVGGVLAMGQPAVAAARRADPIRAFDTDNDGTLDLAEVKKAASAQFSKLDRDHDGTLTQDEYLAVVEQRFNAADPDKDGTLDRKELNSRAGQALLHLLR